MSTENLLRLPEVLKCLGISRTTLYSLVNKGDFPRPIHITPRCVAWKSSDIQSWIESREAAAA